MNQVTYPHTEKAPPSCDYLWPTTVQLIEAEAARLKRAPRILDLGCGVGFFAQHLKNKGHTVVGVDPAPLALPCYREVGHDFEFHVGGDTIESLRDLGKFDIICSLEVVEHVFSPEMYVRCLLAAAAPNALCILSTPYHGYLKNLSIALLDGCDRHFTALWEGGHIKFWSVRTLSTLLGNQGIRVESVHRVGRALPQLAKSMILSARCPAATPSR